MRKIPIVLTLILTLTMSVASPSTQALYKEEDGTIWYTVEELFEYREELDREMRGVCGDDAWCQQEYYFNKMEEEPRVMALDQLTQQQFILTAVNPGEGYIKMLFFGEDTMLKHMGISEEIGIERVFVGWMEYDSERIYSMSLDVDRYANDIDGMHTIYAWGNDYPESNLILSDENVILEADGLTDNADGQLVYTIDSGYGKFNAVGRFSYTSCLSEPDYNDGTECRLMTSAEKGQAYFPPRETILSSENDGNDSDSSNDSNDGNIDGDNKGDDNSNILTFNSIDEIEANDNSEIESNPDYEQFGEGGAENDLNLNIEPDVQDNNERLAVKAPDTGANSGLCSQKIIEFPWWLSGLIILGNATVLWLFWPNRKKVQKN